MESNDPISSPEEAPKKLRKDQMPIPHEEYLRVKGHYPNLDWNDEDQSYTSKTGRKAYAIKLRYLHPLTQEERVQGAKKIHDNAVRSYDKFLFHLRQGCRMGEAAKRAGYSYKTVMRKYYADPEFRKQCEEAEQEAAEPVENSLFNAAVNGNVPAAIKWLEKRAPQRWPGDKVSIEQKNVYEIDASDRIQNIVALMARLQERAELESGPEVIDVDSSEPDE